MQYPQLSGEAIQITRGRAYEPALTVQGDDVWVAWRQVTADATGNTLLARRCGGDRLGEDVRIASGEGDLISPILVPAGDGQVRAVYAAQRDGKWDVYSRILTADGTGEETGVSRDGGSFCPAAVGGGDGAWIAWQSRAGDNHRIRARRLVGGEGSEPVEVSDNASSNRCPALTVDANGRTWIAWETYRNGASDIYLRELTADGPGEPVRVTFTSVQDIRPALAGDADGRVWIAWIRQPRPGATHHRLNDGKRVVVRAYEPETGAFVQPAGDGQDLDGTAAIPVDYRGREVPMTVRIAIAADGSVNLLYRRYRNEGMNDWGWNAEIVRYAGGEWSQAMKLNDAVGLPLSDVAAAWGADGELRVAWQESGYPGNRKGLNDEQSNIFLAAVSPAPAEPPDLAAAIVLAPQHHEQFDASRPDPSRRVRGELGGRELELLWGDLHRHSTLSKCMGGLDGSPADHIRWARDLAQLDFYSLTDHTDQTSDIEAGFGRTWCELYDEPGRFVTLFGNEQNFGAAEHTNFHWVDPAVGRTLRRIQLELKDGAELPEVCQRLDEAGLNGKVLIARHFHGDGFASRFDDAPPVTPDYEWVIEAVQTRGFSPTSVGNYLGAGAKFGLMGGSDHSRWPGGWGGPWVYPRAITALWAEACTREAVFDALRRRRCYATNGKKIVLRLAADGRAMGEAYETDAPPTLTAEAIGTSPLERVELLRDGVAICVETPETQAATIELTDDSAPTGESRYELRVVQQREDGDNYRGRAWSSPIWVTRKG